ncbi:MAG TPA: DUF2905 domain-containing protein [Verrucomicrobiae bacterium]|nr:DUF2905 domain-containing protein [Verrucomicrobiae bacterium]
MNTFGRTLIFFGLILVLLGVLFTFGSKLPWLGRLPGDIYINKGNFTFYFPLTTCLILSLIITLVLYFFRR